MGGCVGTQRGNGGRGSRRPSGFSDSTSSGLHGGTSTKNRPLRHEKIRWKSDIPLTDGQLKSKRDEFWDTAPAFEGKVEIWNALKAAAEAAESDDFDLAQAILDGAGISLPNGSLVRHSISVSGWRLEILPINKYKHFVIQIVDFFFKVGVRI